MKQLASFVLLICLAAGCSQGQNSTPTTQASPVDAWMYGASKSEMDDSVSKFAMLLSSDRLPGDADYEKTLVMLSINEPASVSFRVEGAQLNCSGGYLSESGEAVTEPDACSVRMRFDGKAPLTFGAREYGDSSQFLELEDGDRFISEMLASSLLKAELPIYRRGAPVVSFPVAGFDPKKLAAQVPDPAP